MNPWMRLLCRSCTGLTFERWAFEQLELPADARILEIGANVGQFWYANRDRIPPGWRIEVTDTHLPFLEMARKKLRRRRSQFDFYAQDIFKLPRRDETFDAIVCNHMLHLIGYQETLWILEDIRHLLKPGGTLVTSTISLDDLSELSGFLRDLDGSLDLFEGSQFPVFCMENGDRRLSTIFEKIEQRDYAAQLEIRDADVLADALRGHVPALKTLMSNEGSRAWRSYLSEVIATLGPLHVTRRAGLFLCRR